MGGAATGTGNVLNTFAVYFVKIMGRNLSGAAAGSAVVGGNKNLPVNQANGGGGGVM